MEWIVLAGAVALAILALVARRPGRPDTPPTAAPAPLRHTPRPMPAYRQRLASDADEEADFELGPPVARPAKLHAMMSYSDTNGQVTERLVVIHSMHGRIEDGRAIIRHIRCFCTLRNAPRTFNTARILAIFDMADGPKAITHGLPEIGRWMREKGGLEHASDAYWQQIAAEEANARAYSQERRDMTAGAEHRVQPQPIRVTWTRDEDEEERTEDALAVGYDTDAQGRPSVLFIGKEATVKRGRQILLLPRWNSDRVLRALHAPPEGPAIADVSAWLAALPKRTEHG